MNRRYAYVTTLPVGQVLAVNDHGTIATGGHARKPVVIDVTGMPGVAAGWTTSDGGVTFQPPDVAKALLEDLTAFRESLLDRELAFDLGGGTMATSQATAAEIAFLGSWLTVAGPETTMDYVFGKTSSVLGIDQVRSLNAQLIALSNIIWTGYREMRDKVNDGTVTDQDQLRSWFDDLAKSTLPK